MLIFLLDYFIKIQAGYPISVPVVYHLLMVPWIIITQPSLNLKANITGPRSINKYTESKYTCIMNVSTAS